MYAVLSESKIVASSGSMSFWSLADSVRHIQVDCAPTRRILMELSFYGDDWPWSRQDLDALFGQGMTFALWL
jgi:hypothetical protein